MNIKKLDWNEYHKYIDQLAKKIETYIKKQEGEIEVYPDGRVSPLPYKYIAGVEPDDMFVAIHLSHRLSVPAVTDINLLSLLTNFTNNISHVLVVSNVVETGNTFTELANQIGDSFDTAVLFKDKNSKFKPTHCVEIPESRIYFPWENCGILS